MTRKIVILCHIPGNTVYFTYDVFSENAKRKIMKNIPRSWLSKPFAVGATALLVACVTLQLLLHVPAAWAVTDSCSPPATTYGTDTMELSIPETATYTLWTRLEIPDSTANSILLNIDNGTTCYDIGGSTTLPSNTWEWINYNDGNTANTIRLTLSQGNHSLELIGTAGGVAVDRIEAVSDASCIPSGTGDNCTTPTQSSSPSPTSPSPTTTHTSTTSSSTAKPSGGSSTTSTNTISTLTPTTSTAPLHVSSPVTFMPDTKNQSVIRV